MKLLFFYFWLFFVFVSCFPNTEEEFNGTKIIGDVIEYETNEPIENALININAVSLSGYSYFVDTIRSDSEGKFEFRTFDDSPAYFALGKVLKDGYVRFNMDNMANIFLKRNHVHQTPIIVGDPKAWIRVVLKDSIDYEIPFVRLGASFTWKLGTSLDVDEIFSVSGNRYHKIYIKETNDNNSRIDSFFVEARDTITYRHVH